jgi:dephospho-CoA kinase
MTTDTAVRAAMGGALKAPPSAVLGFAAPIGAGKSIVSTRVASRLAAPRVSFGGYLRRLARERGLDITRENLQDLGNQLVSTDARGFCDVVLEEHPWQEGRPLIIDGIRHIEILEALKEILAPAEVYLIYIKLDRETQAKRLARDELRHVKPLEELEQHPTEIQVRSKLPDSASLVLDGTQDPEELARKVVKFLESRSSGGRERGWDEKNARRIELAEKKSRGCLRGAELAEFDRLQAEYFDYLDAKYPRTPSDLDGLDRIEERLKGPEGG